MIIKNKYMYIMCALFFVQPVAQAGVLDSVRLSLAQKNFIISGIVGCVHGLANANILNKTNNFLDITPEELFSAVAFNGVNRIFTVKEDFDLLDKDLVQERKRSEMAAYLGYGLGQMLGESLILSNGHISRNYDVGANLALVIGIYKAFFN